MSTILLQTNGLSLIGDILKPNDVSIDTWINNAIFEVPHSSRWAIEVSPIDEDWDNDSDSNTIIIGIGPLDMHVATPDIERNIPGVFVEVGNFPRGMALYVNGHQTNVIMQQQQLKGKKAFRMTYADKQLVFSSEGLGNETVAGYVHRPYYRPWISLIGPNAFRVIMVNLGGKKRDVADELPPAKLAKTLWTEKKFADAVVISGDREIPVHRCFLAAALPFFERAFEGSMREASTARVTLIESDPDSVEAMLSYLYTGVVDNCAEADPTKLLPLAHRLEVSDLVEYSAASLAQGLAPQNIARTVDVMRPYKDDPIVQPHWATIVKTMQTNELLIRALLDR